MSMGGLYLEELIIIYIHGGAYLHNFTVFKLVMSSVMSTTKSSLHGWYWPSKNPIEPPLKVRLYYMPQRQIQREGLGAWIPFPSFLPIWTYQGRIQKIQKGVSQTLNSSILDTFYFFEIKFYKNNTKFQRKRGGRVPLGPPLNPPILMRPKM